MATEDVIIACEAGLGQTESGNMRLLAVGSALANHWGGRLICLLAGDGAEEKAEEISPYVHELRIGDFAGEAYNSTNHFRAVRTLAGEVEPGAVLFAHTFLGMDLAPRIAAMLGVGAAANCLSLEPEGDGVQAVRPMYRGRLLARIQIERRPVVATLQGARADAPPVIGPGALSTLSVEPDPHPKVRFVRRIDPVKTGVDIAKAQIIVSGGRGMGERENFELVENLAQALGGVAACSRPLVDMGWFETDRQVGMSGNSVKPKLYVACGISGALEHLHGMRDSDLIVAINTDAEAPIFEVAQLGMVGDVMDVLPPLIEAAKGKK